MPKDTDFDQSVLHATPSTARDVLATYGVAIVPSVLSPKKCEILLSKMWEFFEDISVNMPVPIQRGRKETWPTLLKLCTYHCMLFQHWGVGHADFMWWVRQQPEVYTVFAHILRAAPKELLVSFDGASFHAPPDRRGNPKPNAGWGKKEHWFHRDQALLSPDFMCVQGWVTALPVERYDATLCVLTGSHLLTRQLAEKYPALVHRKNWVRFDDDAISYMTRQGCKAVRIECPPGSLVLWDSRTVHYGAGPVMGRSNPKFRAVCYVSYLPRPGATAKDAEKRRAAFVNRRTTSHWAYPVKLFPEKMQMYGRPPPPVAPARPPVLDRMGRLFASYPPDDAQQTKI